MKPIIFFLLSALFFVSCNRNSEIHFRNRGNIDSIIHIKYPDNPDDYDITIHQDSIMEIVRYIKPETTNESLLSNYNKILNSGDTLFIMENSNAQQAIFAFNFKGKFLFKIDALGKGPGEYQKIRDFYVDKNNKQIGILSFSNILKYDFNGNFIEKLNLQKYYIFKVVCQNNLLYTLCGLCPPLNSSCYYLLVFDLNGKLIYKDLPVRDEIINFNREKSTYFSSNTNSTYLNVFGNDTIYEILKTNLIPRFVIDYDINKRYIPDNIYSKGADYAIYYAVNKQYPVLGVNSYNVTDKYLSLFFDNANKSPSIIYSFRTGKTLYLRNRFYMDKENLSCFYMKSLNGELYYKIVSNAEVMREKKVDEYDGILTSPEKFSKTRIEKYNFIKDVKQGDNDIIVLSKLKDF